MFAARSFEHAAGIPASEIRGTDEEDLKRRESGASRCCNTDRRLTTTTLYERMTMATAQSTGKTRSTRNRPADSRRKAKNTTSPKPQRETDTLPPPSSAAQPRQGSAGGLQELIEEERSRLQSAEAVLACLHFALMYDDYFEPCDTPSYPEVAQVAMGLIRTAVDHLDSLYVGQQIGVAADALHTTDS